MNYTEKYHLPQWAKEDRIMMEDFNGAMAGIENGIATAHSEAMQAQESAAELPYVVGTYIGDGTVNRRIPLDFRPSFIIVSGQREVGNLDTGADRFYVATAGTVFKYLFQLDDSGFTVSHYHANTYLYPNLNYNGFTYDYIAFR